MGNKFSSRKKQGYDFEKAGKSGKKSRRKSGKLDRKWKSVDVYTQTGEEMPDMVESIPRDLTHSMDDLRHDSDFEFRQNGKKSLSSHSSSSESLAKSKQDKKKKKKKKFKKTKDKKEKNSDNEKKKVEHHMDVADPMRASVKVINVSDVSDIEDNGVKDEFMVTNPIYMASELPIQDNISPSSSNVEKHTGISNGDEIAREILDVVSSAQLIEEMESRLDIVLRVSLPKSKSEKL